MTTTDTEPTDLIVRAITNPSNFLPRLEGERFPRWVARAVQAALVAEEQTFVDGQVAQANILGWNMDSGVTDLTVSMALETAAGLVTAAKTFLTATGAQNYVEQHVHDRQTGERYTLTIQRPGGKTPHELRLEAEAERDQLRSDVETHERRYLDVQKVLDVAIGTEVEDGAGGGLVGDVALLAQRYADLKKLALDEGDFAVDWSERVAEIESADLREPDARPYVAEDGA